MGTATTRRVVTYEKKKLWAIVFFSLAHWPLSPSPLPPSGVARCLESPTLGAATVLHRAWGTPSAALQRLGPLELASYRGWAVVVRPASYRAPCAGPGPVALPESPTTVLTA